ncbi:MAG TPA: orotidine 5'-phosphate decarboxylase / HUMPS family protein [Anaerolineales bacterium]|nr:orotidine 5'-phosphate decarboxylase / HUMPS family protein [Anaerolineales bacterium]
MSKPPLIQLALDYFDLPSAIAMAQQVHKEVDILEIGTPLSKAGGMLAVSSIRALCPDNLILADIKSPDVGGGEAKMAFDAGADWMTVLGAAPLDTVKLALEEANSRPGKEMFIELTGIRDILARAREWRNIGVERMVYHRGWDEGNLSRSWDANDLATISELINMGFQISVAGGLGLDMVPFFKDVAISVFIVGRAIRETPDPAATARKFRAAINQTWSDSAGVIGRYEDLAAKAIRWGVSEIGLMLTVDGGDCPGCDSPGRFCVGSRIDIQIPSGINNQQFLERISANLGPGERRVVGSDAPDTFYLDLGRLPQLNNNHVMSILSATGNALNQSGFAVDVLPGLTAAENILSE